MISVMMPGHSWVAKWNDLSNRMPGVYAIQVQGEELEADQEGRLGEDNDGQSLDDWIAKDGEGEDEYDDF